MCLHAYCVPSAPRHAISEQGIKPSGLESDVPSVVDVDLDLWLLELTM